MQVLTSPTQPRRGGDHHQTNVGPAGRQWRVEMRLENKVALITGGYGGMGRASARRFAREGATVFIAGRKPDRGETLAKEINDAGGGEAHFVELDIVNQGQWDAALARVKETTGALHVLMNIVGSNALAKFPNIDVGQWNNIF